MNWPQIFHFCRCGNRKEKTSLFGLGPEFAGKMQRASAAFAVATQKQMFEQFYPSAFVAQNVNF
jgi:hypothetical protein